MSSLKFINSAHWDRINAHLAGARSERFAFAFTRPLPAPGPAGPVVEVTAVEVINDEDVEHDHTGWYIADRALDRIHNKALLTGTGLAEFHNHHRGPPRFSHTDEQGLRPTADYVLDLLPGHCYITAVWAEGQVHAEWWTRDNDTGHGTADRNAGEGEEGRGRGGDALARRGVFDTVLVSGPHLRVVNAIPDVAAVPDRLQRQLPLLSLAGQATVSALRVAVVGAGGTGSQILLQLAYLGFGHVLVLDDDLVEATNLNRLVTAGHKDLGRPKTTVARERMLGIDPNIALTALPGITATGPSPELRDVDLIIGCVDHDGPRQQLNQIAVDTRTLYIDIATGVDDKPTPAVVGGRVALIRPGTGPCLQCLGELDPGEVSRWAKSAHQQNLDRLHGYGTSVPNPSVVHLNALTSSAAISELLTWITGTRAPADWLDIDLVGAGSIPGLQVTPRRLPACDNGCLACGGSVNAASA